MATVAYYGGFFAEVPIRSKLRGPHRRSRTTDTFRRGVESSPYFHQDASDVKRTVAEEQRARPARPFTRFSSRGSAGNDADLDHPATIGVAGLESPCIFAHDEIWLTLEQISF
jgi:hypothetical protein